MKNLFSLFFIFTTLFYNAKSQKVNYVNLVSDGDLTRNIDISKPVGAISVESDVSSIGSANSSFDIYTPPGTNGSAPKISISYNSQGGNGTLGMGWELVGLSSISRSSKNMYHDGVASPVLLDDTDPFLCDGKRLITINGKNGGNGTEYRYELDDFTTIKSYGQFLGISGNPEYFVLETRDGIKYEYGKNANSDVKDKQNKYILNWKLTRIIDLNGNYIEFEYGIIGSNNESKLTKVLYTGNVNGLKPYNEIIFSYNGKTDINAIYSNGTAFYDTQLLELVEVYSENSLVKKYDFKYSYNELYSVLSEVIESDMFGNELNSTIFKYGEYANELEVETSTINVNNSSDFMTGDFNGDGISDLALVEWEVLSNNQRQTKNFKILLKNSPSTFSFNHGPTISLPQGHVVIKKQKIPNQFGFSSIDFDGDGKDEMIAFSKTLLNTSGLSQLDNINVYNFNNIGAVSSTSSFAPTTTHNKIHPSGNFVFQGDFNGDGKWDYITVLSDGSSYKSFITFPHDNELNKNLVFDHFISNLKELEIINSNNKQFIIDFDGDGKSELMIIKEFFSYIYSIQKQVNGSYKAVLLAQLGYPTVWHNIWLGDFNGDRKTDILTQALVNNNPIHANTVWEIGTSTSEIFEGRVISLISKPDITSNGDVNGGQRFTLGDFNGDGKTDIFHSRPDFNSNGTASVSTIDVYYSNGLELKHTQIPHNSLVLIRPDIVSDFNGDGRDDILEAIYDDIGTNKKYDCESYYFRKNGTENLLEKILDGFNVLTEFKYKSITHGTPYYSGSQSSSYPLNVLRVPILNVSDFIVKQGNLDIKNITLKYRDFYFHKGGKGFLGYGFIERLDHINEVRATELRIINPIYYQPLTTVVRTYKLSGAAINLKQDKYKVVPKGGKRFSLEIFTSTSTDFISGSFTERNNTYDVHGNIVSSVVNINNLESITNNTTYISIGSSIPSFPSYIKNVFSRNGSSSTTKERIYTYDSKGNVLTEVEHAGTPCQTTKTITYDNFGNVTKSVLSAQGLVSRDMSFKYDQYGRYPIEKINSLGQTETIEYDNKWGKEAVVEGIDKLVTIYEYDGFGRLILANLPNGNKVEQYYEWSVNNPSKATFKKHSLTPGRPESSIYYDVLGRELRKQATGFDGEILTEDMGYSAKGQLISKTLPYYSTESPKSTINQYDDLGRLIKIQDNASITIYTHTSSNGNLTTTSINTAGQTTTVIKDPTGKVISSADAGGTLTFKYDAIGNLLETKLNNVSISQASYNDCGFQTSLIDPNAGTTTYVYNAYGELASMKDANNKIISTQYDVLGRITAKTTPEGVINYSYYPSGSNGMNKLKKVTNYNGYSEEFSYDAFSHLISHSQITSGKTLSKEYFYDNYDNLTITQYSSGLSIENSYDNAGYLKQIRNVNTNTVLYELEAMNGFGRSTQYKLGNGKTSTITYNHIYPEVFYTPGLQSLQYSYDLPTGNMLSRSDWLKGKQEFFEYDNLDRLTSYQVTGLPKYTMNYDNLGNILSKSDVGSFTYYTSSKINAVRTVSNPNNVVPNQTQQITYSSFSQPTFIEENNQQVFYDYGSDFERKRSILKSATSSTPFATRYYMGDFEYQEVNFFGNKQQYIHYIYGIDGLVAMVVMDNGNIQNYYTYTDNLGSILTVTNQAASLVQEQNFDPWGRMRNPNTWSYSNLPTSQLWLYRGYTGHEHIYAMNLINMNGRLYDPLLARMLSPDNYVQFPYTTQNYNRYTYALNNPLKYNDPSGEAIPAIVGAVIVGAIIGGTVNLATKMMSGQVKTFGDGIAAFGIGALGGAVSGAMGFGMGSFMGAIGYGGFIKGAAVGFGASLLGPVITSMGNTMYFGDPFISVKQYLTGMATSMIIGGTINGIADKSAGKSFWGGIPKSRPEEIISTMPGLETNQLQHYNSNYQNVNELQAPSKFYYYADKNPSGWSSIGIEESKTIYLTDKYISTRLESQLSLALDKAPKFVIEIPLNATNFDPSKVTLTRSITGSIFSETTGARLAAGGGWELLYKGPLKFDQNLIKVIPLK